MGRARAILLLPPPQAWVERSMLRRPWSYPGGPGGGWGRGQLVVVMAAGPISSRLGRACSLFPK